MRKLLFILVLIHCLKTSTAQPPHSRSVAPAQSPSRSVAPARPQHSRSVAPVQSPSGSVKEKIAKVEASLSPGLVVDAKMYTLDERMKHYNVAGVSIAVIDDYKIVWAKGYGFADKKENRKVTPNRIFEPGSISKSLNAVGILQLAQQGKLDLFTDINQYLVDWRFPYDTVSHGKKITTAQLLTHTAGLGVHGFPGYNRDSTIATVTAILDGRPPSNTEAVRSVSEPGLRPRYSGGGILITQQILTDLTKQSYAKYMDEHVLRPLGMTSSSFAQPPMPGQNRDIATGYKSNGNEVPGKYFVYPEKSAAGLWTTPTDLCRYILEMQKAYLGKSNKVLGQEMAKLHLTPYMNDVAMGTYIQDRDGEIYFDHDASNEGFTGVYIAGLTNGKGVAICMNSDDGYLMFELLNSVALVYNWKGFPKPEQITTVAVTEAQTSRYIGDYITDGTFSEVRKENDGLYYWIDGLSSKMYFTSDSTFRNIEFPTAKTFTLDSAGTVTGFSRSFNGQQRSPGKKIIDTDTLKPRAGQWGVYGRHLLETKNYVRAIVFLSNGLESEPSDFLLVKDLAHSYLFNGDEDKSLAFYQQYIKTAGQKASEHLKKDFEFLAKAGFDLKKIQAIKLRLQLN